MLADARKDERYATSVEVIRLLALTGCRRGEIVGLRNSPVFGALPHQWDRIFRRSSPNGMTAHVLRHSFASIANDLGFTEVAIAALVGHAKGSVTGKDIHTLDATLVMAADTIAGYIAGLLDGVEFQQRAYSLNRAARSEALGRCLAQAQRAS